MKNETEKEATERRGTSALTRLLAPRRIEFRAWDSFNGNMIKQHGSLISDLKRFIDSANAHFEGGNGIKIMQFIGLKDCRNKKIFEGDIIKWGHLNEYSKENPVRIAVVKLDPTLLFDCLNIGHEFRWDKFAYHSKELEVIGNIFENPELIP
jgi:uncharacterized phage protein (TIGR01671 family)